MFKKFWLGYLFLLVLVSLISFTAMNAVAYPNPASQTEVDSTIAANALSPPVADKTLYDAKTAIGFCSADRQCMMVLIRNTNQSANVGSEDMVVTNPLVTDTTEGDLPNVQVNQFTTGTQGNLEVAHPDILVCESFALYGYIGHNLADTNGQSIDYNNRSPLPEVVYIGDRSGPGNGESYFAITCDSLAFLSDITDPVYQANGPEFQTLSVTPEVVYLGNII